MKHKTYIFGLKSILIENTLCECNKNLKIKTKFNF